MFWGPPGLASCRNDGNTPGFGQGTYNLQGKSPFWLQSRWSVWKVGLQLEVCLGVGWGQSWGPAGGRLALAADKADAAHRAVPLRSSFNPSFVFPLGAAARV